MNSVFKNWSVKFDNNQKSVKIGDQALLIGKNKQCSVNFPIPQISRVHAKIYRHQEKLFIEDLESSNGTLVNGEKLTAHKGKELKKGDRVSLAEGVINFAVGLSLEKLNKEKIQSIQQLLGDERYTEILLNGYREIWVEEGGRLRRAEYAFASAQQMQDFVQNALLRVGRKIDWKTPFADARLEDGSRMSVIARPASVDHLHVSIRKFFRSRLNLQQMSESGSLGEPALQYLMQAVAQHKNVLISGATGSGKTSMLNALLELVSTEERIITLEDVAELKINHPHVVRLETRPANLEGEGEVSMDRLLKASLRMRPDRIVVGECRGAESLELLQALNTGHKGSMATIHANSPRDALKRLELLVLSAANNINPQTVKNYIQSTIDVVVHLGKKNGLRYLESIQEICGIESDTFLLKEIVV